jgi:hypothetical protein
MELSKILYDEDPEMIGSSIGAPLDEYDKESFQLAASLKSISSQEDVDKRVRELFATASDAFIERVKRALDKFNLRCLTAKQTADGS